MALTIGGLDLSLTSTGIAVVGPLAWKHGGGHPGDDEDVWTTAYRPKNRGYARLNNICEEVLAAFEKCDVIGVEGLITHAKGSSLTDLAGLWWIVTRELTNAGLVWAAISPPTLKGYATGKGVADKFLMFGAAITRLGAVIETNDQADALWAAAATADHYGQPLVQMPQAQRAWLDRNAIKGRRKGLPVVDWPELKEAGNG